MCALAISISTDGKMTDFKWKIKMYELMLLSDFIANFKQSWQTIFQIFILSVSISKMAAKRIYVNTA